MDFKGVYSRKEKDEITLEKWEKKRAFLSFLRM